MPECAEVKLQVDFLNKVTKDKVLIGWNCNSGKFMYEKYRETMGLDILIKNLHENKDHYIMQFHSKGKFIWAEFISPITDSKIYMMCNLGMSGEWTDINKKHNHFSLVCNNDRHMPHFIRYIDPRRFGNIKFTDDFKIIKNKLDELGVDVFADNSITFDNEVIKRFRKFNKKNICEALMNQQVIAGVGNYIKCEALYDLLFSPFADVSQYNDNELVQLYHSCRNIILSAYQLGGASFHTFETNGEKGNASERFNVYGRKFASNGQPVNKETTPDKRTTHFVIDQIF